MMNDRSIKDSSLAFHVLTHCEPMHTKLEFIFSLLSGLTETVVADKNEHLCQEVSKKGRNARLWIHYFS